MEEKYYLVEIIEHLSKTVKVKANSWEEACDKVNAALKKEKIVLTADDYVDREIVGGKDVTDEDLDLYEELEE